MPICPFKIRDPVMLYGRIAYIVAIQRGTRRDSDNKPGIYYSVSREANSTKPQFHVHESQVCAIKPGDNDNIFLSNN